MRLFILFILINTSLLCQDNSQDSTQTIDTCKILIPQFVRSSCPPVNGYPIKYNCNPDTFLLKIFNRWGNLVFETENIDILLDECRDQTRKNQEKLPQGTYFYILKPLKLDKLETFLGSNLSFVITALGIISGVLIPKYSV